MGAPRSIPDLQKWSVDRLVESKLSVPSWQYVGGDKLQLGRRILRLLRSGRRRNRKFCWPLWECFIHSVSNRGTVVHLYSSVACYDYR